MGTFQRNGSPESSIWRTTQDEFRGYVRAKLEDLDQTQKDQWDEHRTIKKRLIGLEKNGQYQLGGIGVLYTVIVVVIAAYGAGLVPF